MVVTVSYLEELFSLNGRVALVTGASGGIGGEIATALAKAGATVALSGRSLERLERVRHAIEGEGGGAGCFPVDIERVEALEPLVERVAAEMGPIEILVNCAGVNRRQPVREVQPETFDHIVDVNLRAPYFLCKAVVPGMIERGGGKIINIGSLTTGWGVGNLSIYGLTKSAIGQMTRVMAVEWAANNVQVNCLCPGWIKTELTRPLWSDPEKSRWILDRTPAARFGLPSDLIGLIVYLSSPAGNFTTGQVFYVDGGFMAGGKW
jgi:NAD(P)-dependent dehydrogenase (short-subunit alcohol dehydrogenase family)